MLAGSTIPHINYENKPQCAFYKLSTAVKDSLAHLPDNLRGRWVQIQPRSNATQQEQTLFVCLGHSSHSRALQVGGVNLL